MSVTDINYRNALDLIIQRYQNKRSIVIANFQALCAQPVLRKVSAVCLRRILQTKENLQALEELGQLVEHWDAVLV